MITDLAEMNPSYEPLPSSSPTMEELFLACRNATRKLTWEEVLTWYELIHATEGMEVVTLTQEEAKDLWSAYATSEPVGKDGAFQSYFLEAGIGVPKV